MTFRPAYAVITMVLFIIEAAIALYAHDSFVRPYLGDVLAVVLVYAGLRAITPLSAVPVAATALIIAFVIEFGQLFHLTTLLGLGSNRLVRVVLGGVFDLKDLACYVVGAVAVLAIERIRTA